MNELLNVRDILADVVVVCSLLVDFVGEQESVDILLLMHEIAADQAEILGYFLLPLGLIDLSL